MHEKAVKIRQEWFGTTIPKNKKNNYICHIYLNLIKKKFLYMIYIFLLIYR